MGKLISPMLRDKREKFGECLLPSVREVAEALPIFRVIPFAQLVEPIERRLLHGTALSRVALRMIRRGSPGSRGASGEHREAEATA